MTAVHDYVSTFVSVTPQDIFEKMFSEFGKSPALFVATTPGVINSTSKKSPALFLVAKIGI